MITLNKNSVVFAAIVVASMWLGVSAAITMAIYTTGNVKCLWFFIIPALCSVEI